MYFRHGADALMLENIAAPYFIRERQPVTIVAVMSLLAKRLRETYPEKRFGIQILAGCPVAEQDLVQTRRAIQKIADKTQKLFGTSYAPPLIIGSGVSINNIDICKRYADSVIVGSSLKRGGYWECELDEERLKKFAELWHTA